MFSEWRRGENKQNTVSRWVRVETWKDREKKRSQWIKEE